MSLFENVLFFLQSGGFTTHYLTFQHIILTSSLKVIRKKEKPINARSIEFYNFLRILVMFFIMI